MHPPLLRPDDHARLRPDAPAVVVAGTDQVVTYAQMAARSRQLAQLLYRRGLRTGDHVAILMDNRPEYLEVVWALRRSGLYYTAVNWHLTAAEAGYIIEDSGAIGVIAGAALLDLADEALRGLDEVTVRLAVGADRPGWDAYERELEGMPDEPLADEFEGEAMLYSSGTTGRPKGILRRTVDQDRMFGDVADDLVWVNRYGLGPDSVALCPAPLYHAAPLVSAMQTHRHGGAVVVLPRFDPELTLRSIEEHRVTFAQFVPTMFVRLLKLPEDVRGRYDVSSLEVVVHAAAPCPVEIKRAMIDWWGPILHEYYSATEAAGMVAIGPDEWLEHPGSVGRPASGSVVIADDDGRVCAAGESGTVWFTEPAPFAYHGDAGQTAAMHNDRGWATMGDVGYLDEAGYLFLTGRLAHTIISGGVNVYPQEIEDLLVLHPWVTDVAVIGVPDPEYGESVKAVVEVAEGAPADPATLAAELIGWCRDRLAHYKCPRTVDVVAELPRTPTGKMIKRVLVERYAAPVSQEETR
jgi:long-chain acyl-CoA synthetase